MSTKSSTLAAVAGLATLLSASPPASAASLFWYRVPSGCLDTRPPGSTELACGELGRFVFGLPGLSAPSECVVVNQGSEEPSLFPTPEPATDGEWAPCQQSGCFATSPAAAGTWVAVVDWDGPHGWSVGETVLQASDHRAEVVLFDLGEAGGSLPSGLPGVSDAHLLAQLCRLSELLATSSWPAPAVLNLSFGRLPAESTHLPRCPGPWLECEVRTVLGELATHYGVLATGAAGNHGELLFPADDAHVVATGTLNLAVLANTGRIAPTVETPAQAEALMPGFGLYLEHPEDASLHWPNPPGSSYASAFLAGWLAGAIDHGAQPSTVAAGRWEPQESGGRFLLSHDTSLLEGSDLAAPDELLAAALGERPGVCSPAPPLTQELARRVADPPPPLPRQTLAEVESSLQQQPGVVICVPCHGGGGSGLASEEPLTITLDRSGPLASSYELIGVFVRNGGDLHALDRSHDPALLAGLSSATLDQLLLLGFEEVLDPDQELALVFTLRVGTTMVWHSTPVHHHTH